MRGISENDSDSDSFDNPVEPEIKDPSPEPPPQICQKRIRFPATPKSVTFSFRNKPFGIDWTFTEENTLVVQGTKPNLPAQRKNLPKGLRLVQINGKLLEPPERLQAQLQNASLPTKLTFFEYGHRCLNFFSPRPVLKANWHIYPEVSNVVAVCDIGMELDLRKVVDGCRNTQFDPGNKAVTVLMKLRNPPCNAMVFRTGRFNITGCRSEVSALIACRKIARKISKVYPQIKNLKNFAIKAVFGSADIGSSVNLQDLHDGHEESSYNKDIRPNCIFYFAKGDRDKEGTCEVSSKGKLNFMGISSIDAFWQRTEELYEKVYPFTKAGIVAQVKLEVKKESEERPPKRRKLGVRPAQIEALKPPPGLPMMVKAEESPVKVMPTLEEPRSPGVLRLPSPSPPR